MSAGDPAPVAKEKGDALFVAYVRHSPPFDLTLPDEVTDLHCAVLRFEGLTESYLGPPNDEALHLHPLYEHGLESYGFWEVRGSPKAVAPLRHWVLTFHDETLEVVATRATVLDGNVPGEDTGHAVQAVLNSTLNRT